MKGFDELFNQYFGNNKPKENYDDKINRIIRLMDNLNNSAEFGNISADEKNLGVPTNTKTFERDGVIFEESTWETEFGTIVRITTKEDIEFTPDFFKKNNIPFGRNNLKEEKLTLEQRLKIAVESENYEIAAEIRDLISKKNNKDITSENLDNKGFTKKDEWNF